MTDPITLDGLESRVQTLGHRAWQCGKGSGFFSDWQDAQEAICTDLAALIAERDAMRAALQAIVSRYEFDGIPNDSQPAVDAARALLKEADHG